MNDIIYNLNPYMLNANHYNFFIQKNTESTIINKPNKIKSDKIKNPRSVLKKKQPDDTLFWMFYTILNKNIMKETINTFEIEKKFKINAIEKLQNDSSILKPFRILKKKEAIHNLQDKELNIYGLHALCLLYKKNIIIVNKYTYYEIHTSDEPFHLIHNTTGLNLNISPTEREEIKNKYIFINDFEKPLKCVTAYKKDELITMAKKVKIQTEGNTKSTMYNSIYDLIKIE